MSSLVEKEFDVRLPLATLMRAQTISEFAEKLRGERDDAVWDVLVPLKTEGSRAPLFLVHDAGGDVLCYRDLVSRLPREQPAYGLQGVGLDRAHVPLIRIPDMATRYVDELRQVQPHGPDRSPASVSEGSSRSRWLTSSSSWASRSPSSGCSTPSRSGWSPNHRLAAGRTSHA